VIVHCRGIYCPTCSTYISKIRINKDGKVGAGIRWDCANGRVKYDDVEGTWEDIDLSKTSLLGMRSLMECVRS